MSGFHHIIISQLLLFIADWTTMLVPGNSTIDFVLKADEIGEDMLPLSLLPPAICQGGVVRKWTVIHRIENCK